MHLVDTIGGTDISTVSLPRGMFETCIFRGDDSEVVATYGTQAQAQAGHAEWVAMLTADPGWAFPTYNCDDGCGAPSVWRSVADCRRCGGRADMRGVVTIL